MSYDRWPPSSEPQRFFDEPEDQTGTLRLSGRGGYLSDEETSAEFRGGHGHDQRGDYGRQEQRRQEPPARVRSGGPRSQRRAARVRARQRRHGWLAVVLLLLFAGGIGFVIFRGGPTSQPDTADDLRVGATATGASSADLSQTPSPQTATSAAPADPAGIPQTGPGTFSYASGTGKVVGKAGTLRRYQVAVEKDAGQNPTAFAATVDRILGDGRGWIANGKSRFQRVPNGATHEFVIYLATPATSEKMCAAGGLHTDRYSSCRLPGQVILNLTRWLTAVPDYGAPLDVYQAYAINHEVGHQLGLNHEACPGKGRPAPVMQQQTLGLKGCIANGWPYVNGARVTGASIP
jgi:hypothetical protein